MSRAFGFAAEFYSEQSYLGREQAVVNALRIRAMQEVAPGVFPFLQAGQELMTAGRGSTALDIGSSFAYVGPGLRYRTGPVALQTELRARAFYTNQPQPVNLQHTFDLRALAIFGKFFAQRLGDGSRFSLFAEPYAELLYTSADFNNVIAAAYVRGGIRWQIAERFAADVYVEPFLTLDTKRHFYNNRADLKPSLRLQFASSAFQASVLASYLVNEYFARGDFDPNPYRDRSAGLRILAVIGGTF